MIDVTLSRWRPWHHVTKMPKASSFQIDRD